MKNKNLFFVLYGASGAGKSTILNFFKNRKDCSIHQKDTTRPPRHNENKHGVLELRFQKKLIPADYAIVYKQYGYFYGIRKDLLEKAIKNNEFHFIIINDVKAIKKFKNKFPQSITFYIHSDPTKIPERIIRRDGISLEQQKRKGRIERQYLDFIRNNILFDHIVVNFWNIQNAKKQIFNIFDLYKK